MNSKQQFGQVTASLTQSKLKIKEIEEKARLKKIVSINSTSTFFIAPIMQLNFLAMTKIYQVWGRIWSTTMHWISLFSNHGNSKTQLFPLRHPFYSYLFQTYNGMTCLGIFLVKYNPSMNIKSCSMNIQEASNASNIQLTSSPERLPTNRE